MNSNFSKAKSRFPYLIVDISNTIKKFKKKTKIKIK